MANLLAYLLLHLTFIIAPITYLISQDKLKLKKAIDYVGLKKQKINLKLAKQTIFILGKLFIAFIVLTAVFSLLGLNDLNKVQDVVSKMDLWLLIYMLIVGVLAEEIFFRGFLVKKIGILGAATLFALFHITYGSLLEIIGAFVLGYILADSFNKNKTLVPNYAAHFLYNLIVLITFYKII